MAKENRADEIRLACERSLTGHGLVTPRQAIERLLEDIPPDMETDTYGAGEEIEALEAETAELLGKEAAIFMPSGTMAQQVALRIWSERTGRKMVAMHPLNHLDFHENYAYQRLHDLQSIALIKPPGLERLLTVADLDGSAQSPGTLLLELPQREIGGQLPVWDELVGMTSWARSRGAKNHMDGARLWECRPFYNRSYAEICSLFDSVYVSFYKIIAGIAGAALAGPADFIEEARVWRHMHGGRLIRMFPMVISAKRGLDDRLCRMADYHEKAVEIAAALEDVEGVEIVPNPPQTNMMHLFLRADGDRLHEAALDLSEETGIWLTDRLIPSPIHAYRRWEFTVGDATLELPTDEIAGLLERWLDAANC
ncbi:aminotransferase class I/II-fold pyridoxal phosphate-dependent enzyme [soil metagenome]